MINKLSTEFTGISTQLVHSGANPLEFFGFVNPPVVRASTVLFPDADIMKKGAQPYTYGIHGTPTTKALTDCLSQLEGATKTFLVPSGLAAITVALLGALKTGDHLLVVDSVYGPTRRFVNNVLRKFGIEVEFYNPLSGVADLLKPNTKAIYTESPGSNTFEIQDIDAIVEAAHATNAVVLLDNTWATPIFFKPLEHGVDISINAATKYQAGHSDILMGYISTNEATTTRIEQTYTDLGMSVSGDDAYLVLRSMRSMNLRLTHQQDSALFIAKWLEDQPEILAVLHPALEAHPHHALWKQNYKGSSGLFSFVLKSGDEREAHAFLDALELFGLGYSWGSFESLAVHVNLEDRLFNKDQFQTPVIRLQIGLEERDDLIKDLRNGLDAIKNL